MHDQFQPTVYILASGRNGTLYTGVTSDLFRRIDEHREEIMPGFTSKHGVKRLVWFEQHGTMEHAITREKRIKKWNRAWKLRLIEEANPRWRDLAEDFGFEPLRRPTAVPHSLRHPYQAPPSSSPRRRGPRARQRKAALFPPSRE